MKKTKEPFFKKVIASIKDFDRYQDFAVQKLEIGIKYFFKLALLVTIIISIGITVKSGQVINKTVEFLKNDCPNFKFEDNLLSVDTETGQIYDNIDEFQGIIIVDTRNDISTEELDEYNKKLSLYNNSIFLLKDKVILKNEMLKEEITTTYKEITEKYNINYLDKNQVIEYFSTGNFAIVLISIFISVAIVLFILYVTELLIGLLALMVLGYLTGRIIGLRLRATNVFNIVVHAMTLSVILRIVYVIVNLFTGFYIRYFDTMYITIIYIYIITALFIIRSALIKQQIELMRIVEEEKKVKEELKENQDKQEDKQEDEQDKEDKEKEEENKDNNIGKEANGEV